MCPFTNYKKKKKKCALFCLTNNSQLFPILAFCLHYETAHSRVTIHTGKTKPVQVPICINTPFLPCQVLSATAKVRMENKWAEWCAGFMWGVCMCMFEWHFKSNINACQDYAHCVHYLCCLSLPLHHPLVQNIVTIICLFTINQAQNECHSIISRIKKAACLLAVWFCFSLVSLRLGLTEPRLTSHRVLGWRWPWTWSSSRHFKCWYHHIQLKKWIWKNNFPTLKSQNNTMWKN